MKHRCLFVFTFMLLALLLTAYVFASGGYVHDDAEVLEPLEGSRVLSELERVGKKHGIDAVIVTADGIHDYELESYAANYYDNNGYSDDGVLILINPETGSRYISACGKAIDAIDPKLSEFTRRTGEMFDSHRYAEAFTECAHVLDDVLVKEASFDILWSIAVNLAIGFAAAFIVTSSMKSSLKSVRMQSMASGYMKSNSLNITRANDFYLYRTVTRVAKSGSSSGSTCRSSSGRSRGGGRF